MSRLAAVAGAAVLAVAIAACGSSGNTSKSTAASGSISRQQAAGHFMELVGPVDQQIKLAGSKLAQLPSGTVRVKIRQITGPAVNAISEFNRRLSALGKSYRPAGLDLTNLESADQPLIVDFQGLTSLTPAKLGAWKKQLLADVDKIHAADDRVREDLGLPPKT